MKERELMSLAGLWREDAVYFANLVSASAGNNPGRARDSAPAIAAMFSISDALEKYAGEVALQAALEVKDRD